MSLETPCQDDVQNDSEVLVLLPCLSAGDPAFRLLHTALGEFFAAYFRHRSVEHTGCPPVGAVDLF